ncbi:MAG: hypothetical protein HN817_07775 [Porticoccaceae bacterium]|jgi:hypothetical protein|nr:hypothetical protein [Porticoccaceae bacterium]MBT5577390.1 hypothetical protein [Porticoccaceae bacterium]MBT7375809.1 hypothetical protein [Porticoccaceae bacterium]
MALTEFELIMLDNGEVALQRSGSDKALVRIKFSGEVLDYLGGKHLEVAKNMMDAGLQAVFEINEERAPQAEEGDEKRHTLH